MGYRHEIFIIDKEVSLKLQNKKLDDFLDNDFSDDDYKSYDWPDLDKVALDRFMLGKLYWGNDSTIIEDTTGNFFNNEAANKYFNDENVFALGNKDTLKTIIDLYINKAKKASKEYHQRIEEVKKKYDKDSISKDDLFKLLDIFFNKYYIEYMATDSEDLVYNLKEDNRNICQSYEYEHCIFELIRLYKHTDWNKYDLILTAG